MWFDGVRASVAGPTGGDLRFDAIAADLSPNVGSIVVSPTVAADIGSVDFLRGHLEMGHSVGSSSYDIDHGHHHHHLHCNGANEKTRTAAAVAASDRRSCRHDP